jgi:hypothetical protein
MPLEQSVAMIISSCVVCLGMNAAVTLLCVVMVALNAPHNTSALLLAAAKHASKLQYACKP